MPAAPRPPGDASRALSAPHRPSALATAWHHAGRCRQPPPAHLRRPPGLRPLSAGLGGQAGARGRRGGGAAGPGSCPGGGGHGARPVPSVPVPSTVTAPPRRPPRGSRLRGRRGEPERCRRPEAASRPRAAHGPGPGGRCRARSRRGTEEQAGLLPPAAGQRAESESRAPGEGAERQREDGGVSAAAGGILPGVRA